jgi:hypothetical protein
MREMSITPDVVTLRILFTGLVLSGGTAAHGRVSFAHTSVPLANYVILRS